jgi:hypothetical protein
MGVLAHACAGNLCQMLRRPLMLCLLCCAWMQVLEEFGIPLELTVVSAHRTPEKMMAYARSAHQRGIKAIIAGAGVVRGWRAALCCYWGTWLDGCELPLPLLQVERPICQAWWQP